MKALPLLCLLLLPIALLLPTPALAKDGTASAAADAEAPSPELAKMFEVALPASALDGGPLEALKPFIGRWEIDATWGDGSKLHSRNEYEVRMGGKFVFARTFVKQPDGNWYQRYETVFGHEEGKGMVTWGFTYDGTFTPMDDIEVTEKEGRVHIIFNWAANGAAIRQSVTDIDGDSYSWRVAMKGEGAEDFTQVMDGVWKRIDAE